MAIDAAYRPRNPGTTVLYQVAAEQLETFLSRQQERDRPVPRFVEFHELPPPEDADVLHATQATDSVPFA